MDLSEKIDKIVSKTKLGIFSQFGCSDFKLELCEKLHSYQIVQKIKFEGDSGEVELKICFQRPSWTKYMRQYRKTLISTFQQLSTSIKKKLSQREY